MKEKTTFFNGIPNSKRKQLREKLKKAIELRTKQRNTIIDGVIEPINQQLKLANDVMKNKIPVEYYIKRSEKLSKHLKGILEWKKKK